MKKNVENNSESLFPYECFLDEQERLTSLQEWVIYFKAFSQLKEVVYKVGLLFDSRFNSVHWAFDVSELINQISLVIVG